MKLREDKTKLTNGGMLITFDWAMYDLTKAF